MGPDTSQPAVSIPVMQPSLGEPPSEAVGVSVQADSALQLHSSVPAPAAATALQHPLPAPAFAASAAGVPAPPSAGISAPAGDVKPQVSAALPAHSAALDAGTQTVAASIATPALLKADADVDPGSTSAQPQLLPSDNLSPDPGISAALPLCDGKNDVLPAAVDPGWMADGGCAAAPADSIEHIPPASAVLPPVAAPAASPLFPQPLANGGSGMPASVPGAMPSASQPQQPRPAARSPKAEPKVVFVDGSANNGASASPQPVRPPAVSAPAAQTVRVSGNGRPIRSPKGKKVTSAAKGAKPVAAGSGQESKR